MADENTSFLDSLLGSVYQIFKPLSDISQPDQVVDLFEKLGYDLGVEEQKIKNLCDLFISMASVLSEVEELMEAINSNLQITDLPNYFNKIKNITSKIMSVSVTIKDWVKDLTLSEETIKSMEQAATNLPLRLLDYLLTYYLKINQMPAFSIMLLCGMIKKVEEKIISIPPNAGSTKKASRYEIQWALFPKCITNPLYIMETAYDWRMEEAHAQFNSKLFFTNLMIFLDAFNFPGGQYQQNIAAKQKMGKSPSAANEHDDNPPTEIRFPLDWGGNWPEEYWEIGFSLSAADKINETQPKGLAIIPYICADADKKFTFTISCLDFYIDGGLDMSIQNGVGVNIRPPYNLEFFNNLFIEDGCSLPASIEIQAEAHQNNDLPVFVIGSDHATGFSINGVSLDVKFTKTNTGGGFGFELSAKEIKLVVGGGDGDGFIQKILPKDPIRICVHDFVMGISTEKGFYISGGAGMAFVFQVNQQIGPIYIAAINLGLDISDGGMSLLTGISGSAQIGPVIVSVDNIGLKTDLIFGQPGLLGKADLDFTFKPPDGIGLAVESDVIQGGGKLLSEKPNYVGFIDLSVKDKFTLKAFGLLTTQMPDGSSGYSLVIEILTEFTPVQLGFGFALKGVGGLIGINRMMCEDALRETVKNHSLDCILFPESPIKDSTRIISAIQGIFPAKKNYFVFGLMAKIIWGGSIDLVKFMAGIIVETGGSGRVAILGTAKTSLPDENLPLLVLNMDLLGFIDFGKATLAIDASLFDSRIVNYTLSGQMALRANWGEKPDFVLSIGGFHPRYSAPPGFPALQRLGLSIRNSFAQLDLTAYLAITTNTLQLGASLSISADLDVASVSGEAGFDALIIFRPFHFDTDVYAWVKVRALGITLCGVSLDFNLTGPNPFHAKGTASVEILWCTIDVDFDATFGDESAEALPVVHPLEDLQTALDDSRNIRYALPAWAGENMVYAKGAEKFLDPLGEIVISQNVVPLCLEMQFYGGGRPADSEKTLDIGLQAGSKYEIGGPDPTAKFSPAQFKDWDDAQKLAAPAFEDFKSGIRLSLNYESDTSVQDKLLTYEPILFESEKYLKTHGKTYDSRPAIFLNILNKEEQVLQNAATTGSGKYFQPSGGLKKEGFIKVHSPTFAVSNGASSDGRMCSDMQNGMTYTQAADSLQKNGAGDASVMDACGLQLAGA